MLGSLDRSVDKKGNYGIESYIRGNGAAPRSVDEGPVGPTEQTITGGTSVEFSDFGTLCSFFRIEQR